MSNNIGGRAIIAIDCEMVEGVNGSMLAKVAIVDYNGQVVYNEYVAPTAQVTDYRSFVSGIQPQHLQSASTFQSVQRTVADYMKDKIIVGHSLKFDLDALGINHHENYRRDLATWPTFIKTFGNRNGQTASLRDLAAKILQRSIQNGIHKPDEDAKASMDIYKKYQSSWN